jgi:hypothetical protein
VRDAGDIPRPCIWVISSSLDITGGHCDDNYSPSELKPKSQGIANELWAVKAKMREDIKYRANAIKFYVTSDV